MTLVYTTGVSGKESEQWVNKLKPTTSTGKGLWYLKASYCFVSKICLKGDVKVCMSQYCFKKVDY